MIKTRLVRLLAHARKYIAGSVAMQWLALICQIAIVFSISGILQAAYEGTLVAGDVKRAAVILIAAALLKFVFGKLQVRASYAASVDVKRILREKIYSKLLRLGASYREKVSTAEVVQMSVEGVEQLETYFGRYLGQLFYSLLAPLTLFVVLFRVNRPASIILLVFVPLIPMSIVAVQKIAKKLLSKYWGAYTELGDSFLENLQGLTTLKIYKADGQRAEMMDEESEIFRKITMKVLTMQLNSTSVMDIMAYGGAAAGMIVALRQFFAGSLGLGGAIAICLLASEFFIPLRVLGSFFHIAMNGMAASDRIFDFLDLPEPRDGEERVSGNYQIKVRDASYSYDGKRKALDGIDIDLDEGGFVSLVGPSGCGKSTVAGILSGANKGYEGSITIGGTELSRISEESLMESITLVASDSYIFKGTVRENLMMAGEQVSEDEMMAALGAVNLRGFAEENGGLDMEIAEQGGNLSGGQRQRLAIARALLRDTPVYIFDEATSNIDMESEEMIMDVIRQLSLVKTVILISHRLANVTESDVIYMMGGGEVIESGTHESLMAAGGEYGRLFAAQRELEGYGKEAGR